MRAYALFAQMREQILDVPLSAASVWEWMRRTVTLAPGFRQQTADRGQDTGAACALNDHEWTRARVNLP